MKISKKTLATVLIGFASLIGIVGIFLFLGPFVYLIIKNIKKISTKNVMYLFAVCLAFGLSFFASYVMFSTTCMFILSILLNMYIKGEEK